MLVSLFGADTTCARITIKTVTHWEHLQFPYRKIIASTHKSYSSSTDGTWFSIAPHNPESLFSTLAFQKEVNKQWITLCVCIGQKALSTWTHWSGYHLSRWMENSKKKKKTAWEPDKREPDSPGRPRVTVKTTQKLHKETRDLLSKGVSA